jgi:hypothetical protein
MSLRFLSRQSNCKNVRYEQKSYSDKENGFVEFSKDINGSFFNVKNRGVIMNNSIKTLTLLTILFLTVNLLSQNTVFNLDASGAVIKSDESSLQLHPTKATVEVNELHMVPDSGRSGHPISISFTINNTEQFVGFQFDMILPSVITFIQDSIWLYRKTNHVVLANMINQQTLRILAYSISNQPFIGNDGEILSVMFNLNGIAGTYNVGLNNVVISNAVGVNILTGYFPGYIKIIAPDISGITNIDFGETSVLDTISYHYQLSNTGNDTLFVNDFSSSEIYFWNDTPLPKSIPPGEIGIFTLKFHNIIKGQYSATITIRSNDPDEDPFTINALATSFAPNYMLIQNAEAFVGDTVTLKIDVNNYEQFFEFQVDINFPDNLSYVPNSSSLTGRKQDHSLFEVLLTPNKLRLFTFSLNHLPFTGNSGTVVTMNFVAGTDTGHFPLQLSGGILFDSTSQNIIRGTIDGEIYIKPIPTFPLTVSIANGWNIVSIPGKNPVDQNVNMWWQFRDMTTDVFKYSGGYVPVTTVTPGVGYWMKHAGARTYNTGDEWPSGGIQIVPHNPVTATAGWNLIGGYELSVLTANVTTNPPGLQSGLIYKYSTGYQIANTLDPGYGYWIKISGAGQIIIPETLAKETRLVKYFPDDWGRIVLKDASGINYTLYAVKGEVDLNLYDLPPAPPSGMFDIRYGSGRIAEDINSSVKSIELNGVTYPVTVRVENMDIRLMDETGKTINVNLKSGEEVIISDGTIQKLKVSGELLPTVYSLEQNYPNPFNPSTVIEFSLPEDVSNVKLSIYNALGEKVAELVNSSLTAGKYQYQWNAQNVATGMYIYELRTDKFVSVKKMLLLK